MSRKKAASTRGSGLAHGSRRGLRASAVIMVGQAVVSVGLALEDDQSFVQTEAPRVQSGGVFLFLSSDQQPQ